jgi:magnesium-transporting ATPase (P-type)
VNLETSKKMGMTTGIFIATLLITMVLSVVYFVIAIVGMQVVGAKDVNSLDCMIATLKFSTGAVTVLLLCQYTMAIIFFLSIDPVVIGDMLLYLA